MGIAVITDFGREIYPGLMKSVIRSINPKTKVIDIAHELPPQDIKTAAYVLRATHRRLPNEFVILGVVDPGVGTSRRVLVARAEAKNYNYYFVVPDNGLISVVHQYVKELLGGKIEYYALRLDLMSGSSVSRTFHGRDLFAPLAAKIDLAVSEGKFEESINELGLEPIEPIINNELRLEVGKLGKLRVAFIDRFGDIVLNSLRRDPKIKLDLREKLFESDKYIVKSANGSFIARPSRFYDPNKRIIVTVGSQGLLEIARPYGSAAILIGEVDEVEIKPL